MSVTVGLALISGLVALASVGLSSYAAIRTTRMQNELETRRDRDSRADAIKEVMARYRNPLLRSAIDLQGRLCSIVENGFMTRHLSSNDPEWQEYGTVSTLFRLAEYFGWVEILRRGVQFLDLGNEERSQELAELLQEISLGFANTHDFPDGAFRLFRDEQRALGESVLEPVPGDPRGFQCIGYAQFVERLSFDPSFARWFKRLEEEAKRMDAPPPGYLDRLAHVDKSLQSLLEFLDPGGTRYPNAKHIDEQTSSSSRPI
jgi:hypothetical protein